MVRVVTQILIGLMIFFGAVNLAIRAMYYFRQKNLTKTLLFLSLSAVALFIAVLAFYYAYSGLSELWK